MTTKKIDFDLFKEWVALLSQHGIGMITMMEVDAAIEKLEFEQRQSEKKKEYDLYEHGNDGVLWDRILETTCRSFFRDYPEKYPADMFPEFIRYWSEPNGKGHPRWWSTKNQKNGRWHLPGRLATWFRNYKPLKQSDQTKNQVPDRLKLRVV